MKPMGRLKVCRETGKKRHPHRDSAVDHAIILMRHGRATERQVSVYQCDACKDFHVGHMPRRSFQ